LCAGVKLLLKGDGKGMAARECPATKEWQASLHIIPSPGFPCLWATGGSLTLSRTASYNAASLPGSIKNKTCKHCNLKKIAEEL
jgi:hypothetical protein